MPCTLLTCRVTRLTRDPDPVTHQLDPAKPGAGVTSEGVLANFFNSLLNKKAGSPGGLNKSGTDSGEPCRSWRAQRDR